MSDDVAPRNERWVQIAKARAKQIDQNRGGILIIGDSIAWRWPVELQKEYFGRPFINLGVSGDRIENVVWRLPMYDLPKADPSAVVIVLGTNNLRTDTAAAIQGSLQKFIEQIRTKVPEVPVVVSEILPRGKRLKFKPDDIQAINRNLAENAMAGGYSVLRVHNTFVDQCNDEIQCHLLYDFVHPNDAGYRIISAALRSTLASR